MNAVQLHVDVQGTGEPILLLHGFPDSRLLWRRLAPHLHVAGYQTIAPDLRGLDFPKRLEVQRTIGCSSSNRTCCKRSTNLASAA